MTESLKLGKKAFTLAVVAATILWTVGFAALVAPSAASAAVPGNLVMGETLTTVYYYAADGQRYAFPNEKTYFTWYEDFDGVVQMTDSELAAIPLAGNIVYRPGSRWIKIESDPKTYAVSPQGQIHWIESEEVAVGLAGDTWNTYIDDVPDVFFVDYTVGTSLMDAEEGFNGAIFEGSTYLIWNGEVRLVTPAGFSANGFQDRFILRGTGIDKTGMPAGDDVTGMEAELADPSQLGEIVTGGLSISLATDTPASATIPANASSVPFTKFKFTATSGSASVSQLIITLGGIGGTDNLDDVYLYEGNMRLTNGRSINASTRQATFSGLTMDWTSGETSYITARADASDSPLGGDTANLGIKTMSDVVSTATVSGSFPVTGNTMTFSTTMAGTLTITDTGSITDPTIGQQEALVAKFKAEADGEDAWIEQISLTVEDAADHENFQLWDSTELVSACDYAGGDLVSCPFVDPFFIAEGNSNIFSFTLDVGGESGETIGTYIEEEADVLATGGDYGFNLAIDVEGFDASGGCSEGNEAECGFCEIQGGQLTFAFNGPAADDIMIDGDDQVFMEFAITAEEWTLIEEVGVNVFADVTGGASGLVNTDPNPDEPNLEDISIRYADSGGTWMGPKELDTTGSDQSQDLLFDDQQSLNGGTTTDFLLTADVNADAVPGDVFYMTLLMGDVRAEDYNGDTLDEIVPTSNIVGHDMTIADANLLVQASTPPGSGTYVKGSSGVDVLGISFRANGVSPATITDLTISAVADDDGDLEGWEAGDDDTSADVIIQDHVNSCSLYDDETGTLVDGPESFDEDGDAYFDAFWWTVDAGESEKLILSCNFSNVDVDDLGANPDMYAFFIDDEGNVLAEDDDGDPIEGSSLDLGNEADDGVNIVNGTYEGEDVGILIIQNGDLEVTLSGSTPKSTIILGDSDLVHVGAWKFNASDEGFYVEDVTLANCVTDGSQIDEDGDCDNMGQFWGDDAVAAEIYFQCTDDTDTEVWKSGSLSGNFILLEGMECYVPPDETPTFNAYIDTNYVGGSGAESGDMIQLNFAAIDGIYDFRAVGQSSGEAVDETFWLGQTTGETYLSANEMTVRKTKPTISLANGSPSGAGVPGLSEVFRFNVSADSRGFVTLNGVSFAVTTSDDAYDGAGNGWSICGELDDPTLWEFYDASDPSEKLDDNNDWFFLDDTDGSNDCTTNMKIKYAILDLEGSTDTAAEEIGAGSTNTYVVRVDTSDADGSADDKIRLDIPDQTTMDGLGENCASSGPPYCYSMYGISNAGETGAISWNDADEGYYIGGDYIKNLPVSGGTIVY